MQLLETRPVRKQVPCCSKDSCVVWCNRTMSRSMVRSRDRCCSEVDRHNNKVAKLEKGNNPYQMLSVNAGCCYPRRHTGTT